MSALARPGLSPSPSTDRIVSGSLSSRNPISLRLYKALALSFQDSSSRDALETLSALYAPPSTEPSTSYISHKTIDVSDEDDDEDDKDDKLFARKLHSRVSGDPSIAENARKNLRRDVELQLADSSSKFLQAFGEVDQVCNNSVPACAVLIVL